MKADEARRVVQEFMKSLGQTNSEGLNERGFGGAVVDLAQVYFEYRAWEEDLKASALIYKFSKPPKPGIIEGFQEEEKKGTDTGGGKVDYEDANKGLYLSRSYTKAPTPEAFQKDMQQLMKASLVWGDEVLKRVSAKVFKT